jgi:hypothetical protein
MAVWYTFAADSGGRAVQGVGLQQLLDIWEGVSESLVFVVCCVGSGLCDELIARAEEFYWVFVCV